MKSNKGITLILLIVIIIIMLILLGIVTIVSRDILEKSKGEKLLTYMKLVELRANAYYEELDFRTGEKDFENYLIDNKDEVIIKPDDEFEKIESKYEEMFEKNCCFIKWDKSKLIEQGIDATFLESEDEYFIIAYAYDKNIVENVYYNKGIYLNGNDKPFYSMSDLEKEMSK